MRMIGQLLGKVCALTGLVGCLAGCALLPKERIARSTADYNLVVEKVQNQMLLLNIVRASMRRPMYFTGFNLLRGSMSYAFQTGDITIPFGKIGTGLNGAYSVVPGISYSTNPSFDLMVWDSKEFTAGIMTPVSLDTLYHYLETQGWPAELLLHLLVGHIEHRQAGIVRTVYENDPEDRNKLERFQAKIRELQRCRLESRERHEPIGPVLAAEDLKDLEHLVQVHKAGLTLQRMAGAAEERYQLSAKKTDYFYRCGDDTKSGNGVYRISDGSGQQRSEGDRQEYRMFLRSPQGVLYYLGEILRVEMEQGYTPTIAVCESKTPVPLFLGSRSNSAVDQPAVTVDYEGDTYFIPGNRTGPDSTCTGDRSMHVLSFISQLIAEQKAGMNVPVTGAVTAVGR